MSLGSLWAALQTAVLAVLGFLFIRAKADEMGREMVEKTLDRLRGEIEDRDRVAIGQREQINALSGRVELIGAEVVRKEAQVSALLEENLSLKQELRKLKLK